MPTVGFHASHEQLAPSTLLDAVCLAEQHGFTAAMSSDHFAPWSARQGESGFAWSWLGAAMQATTLPFGVVTAPGQRHHPAVLAQAIATLGEMFPGRLWVALGSGEASNEHITGDRWPDKPARNARLLECAEVIRALLAGDEVLEHDAPAVLAHACTWEGATVVAVHDLSAEPCRLELRHGVEDAVGYDDLLNGGWSALTGDRLELKVDGYGYGYGWHRIQRRGQRVTP